MTTTIPITTSFLLLSILLLLTPLQAKPVLDIAGNPLLPNTKYYILPVNRRTGGGLSTTSLNTTTPCPLYVAQHPSFSSSGLPLTFSPADTGATTIEVSADVNVRYEAVTVCIESNVWTLAGNSGGERLYVATNGVGGNPGRTTVSNWFSFDEAKVGYKIVFCPGVCSICRVRCGEIGVFVERRKRFLGLDGAEFHVVFKKV